MKVLVVSGIVLISLRQRHLPGMGRLLIYSYAASVDIGRRLKE